jgi:hypothetical protein
MNYANSSHRLPLNSRHRRWRLTGSVALAGALALFPLGVQAQQSTKSVTLEEALKQIEALKKQVTDLEKIVKAELQKPAAETSSIAPAPASTPAGSAPAQASAIESGFVKWNELVLGKSKVKLYGFLRLDAVHDDSRPNNTQIPAFIRSEDPAAPAAIASARDSEDLSIYPRLTRFGLDFTGPEVAALGGAKATGKAEIDFYNMPSSESRNAPRIRHAYLKLGWNDAFLLAGQTSDVISPMFPIVNPDFVMWGAGNLGDRRPQLRGEWTPKAGLGNFVLQGEAGLTGADDAQDLDPISSGGFRDGEASGKPTLQARVAYAYPVWEKQKLELGVWGHRAWERTDTAIGTSLNREFDSHAVGLDLSIPVYRDIFWLKGEAWAGKNLSDVRGGILQGINTATGQEVDSKGGWLELGVRPVKWLTLNTGYAMDNPQDGDLALGARSKNSIWYGAVRGYFDPIEIGMDYLNWTTDYVGFGPGVDNRFQWYISYKF